MRSVVRLWWDSEIFSCNYCTTGLLELGWTWANGREMFSDIKRRGGRTTTTTVWNREGSGGVVVKWKSKGQAPRECFALIRGRQMAIKEESLKNDLATLQTERISFRTTKKESWILTLALNLSQFVSWSYCDDLTFDWFYCRFPYAAVAASNSERRPRKEYWLETRS